MICFLVTQEHTYVHLLNPGGYPGGTTCETLGFLSIKEKDECYDAYTTIVDISDFKQYGDAVPCSDVNPNHCFSSAFHKLIFFTKDDCPVHDGEIVATMGLICKGSKGTTSIAYTI